MSNHFAKISIGIWNVSSATGNHAQHAAGLGRAVKYYDSDSIVFSSQGDSSCSEGYVFEALNGASREQLPVIFVVQNNGYGISVPVTQQTANPIVSENYRGLRGLTIINCDGTNPFDSTFAVARATHLVRKGRARSCSTPFASGCMRIPIRIGMSFIAVPKNFGGEDLRSV